MIITLSSSTLNKHCAALLAKQLHLTNVSDIFALAFNTVPPSSNSLFILDVDAQPILISRFKPEELAKYLIEAGLPRSIKHIYLIMSDIDRDNNLVTYAHELALNFSEYYQRKMVVHIPSQLSYDFTLLTCPSKSDLWEIHGFNKQQESQSPILLWQGIDLVGYMNDEQQTYTGISYAWPSA